MMIQKLSIENYKSIKSLDFSCNKINLFIGEPNTGKSNLIEIFGLINSMYGGSNLSNFIRIENMQNLFHEDLVDDKINIKINDSNIFIEFNVNQFKMQVKSESEGHITRDYSSDGKFKGGSTFGGKSDDAFFDRVKFYKYKKDLKNNDEFIDHLLTPNGDNLFSLVYGNKNLRRIMSDLIASINYKLVFRPQVKSFEIQKQTDDVIISHPYSLISDTIASIVFYTMAIESNSNSVLVFEEPENHTFPYYTKYLGEKIAKDTSNQYFIVTHNPYFLQAILEKANKNAVNVFGTYVKNYQTRLMLLSDDQKQELLDGDPFFNLENILDRAE